MQPTRPSSQTTQTQSIPYRNIEGKRKYHGRTFKECDSQDPGFFSKVIPRKKTKMSTPPNLQGRLSLEPKTPPLEYKKEVPEEIEEDSGKITPRYLSDEDGQSAQVPKELIRATFTCLDEDVCFTPLTVKFNSHGQNLHLLIAETRQSFSVSPHPTNENHRLKLIPERKEVRIAHGEPQRPNRKRKRRTFNPKLRQAKFD